MINFKNWKYLESIQKVIVIICGTVALACAIVAVINVCILADGGGTQQNAQDLVLNVMSFLLMWVTVWGTFETC